ncbi:MAG: hypothetical protein EOO70_02255 [Myxococcaceae bacterium]|nr:MAG: hypothetical protein EOO70_02255 [Myxococcaceae bacterium]
MGNPAFPLWPLRGILLKDNPRQLQRCAWFNPVVPVLLMKEPLPEYRARATRLLYEEFQSIGLEGLLPRWPVTLDQLVALSLQQSASERAQPLRHLAHRLASLFALPWPEAT